MKNIENPHIYQEELEKEVRKNKFIPRKCKEREHLKLYHRYWNEEYGGIIKVENIELINNIEYYTLKNITTKMILYVPYPIYNTYELLHNYDNIDKVSVINNKNSFTGAEIKFWFIMNKIDLNSKKYYGFSKYLYDNEIMKDNRYYFVKKTRAKDNQFKMILDENKRL